jgi:hypothetical protein
VVKTVGVLGADWDFCGSEVANVGWEAASLGAAIIKNGVLTSTARMILDRVFDMDVLRCYSIGTNLAEPE